MNCRNAFSEDACSIDDTLSMTTGQHLAGVVTGKPLTIGFNAQYITDFLKAAGSGDVRLELKDSQSAGQLRPAESEDYKYRYIVMPMRI